mmetsp:Transcript_4748/g.7388  ORF Transcript_4748/g.7388 Transcript_4748/m.7388 type:complete len:574 (-) Transcript_4748:1010-2731(-)|eukprot:CAMPEP_0184655244 /NCGR_PEP_ID=MMETSP0308-20130426/12865_1 /TAXON_ID=38269 /ORGANISM="Gloeochaete witrockiana, Strain SAG 46.84" /LENGTH=573 /DNA_ID=CAMNT_0027091611 /DNA_START=188 /DNA_END=1909 /DNA_ORIENTATION=+
MPSVLLPALRGACAPVIGKLISSPVFATGLAAAVAGLQKRFKHHHGPSFYSPELETHHKFKPVTEIINEQYINDTIERTKMLATDESVIDDILAKAKDRALLKDTAPGPGNEFVQGLSVEEAAILLNVDSNNEKLMSKLFNTALAIKENIYGNRIVLFAPLYLANYCVNSCTYCAFRAPNRDSPRNMLSDDDLRQEVAALQKQGHRRLLMLTGESPKYTFDHFLHALKIASEVKTDPCGNIRRINVEIPSLSVSDFRRLKATNCVGTYTLFQESYHRPTYERVHPWGPKSDYEYRVQTFDRAQTGGIDDVGIGALFGLYEYKFEVLAMLQHAHHLDKTYGAGPHTISIPRMQPAENAPDANNVPFPVSDPDFKKLVAVIRCAVPYTGMILSTRENADMRRHLLKLGISQMSAGSKTDIGSYSKAGQIIGEHPHHYNLPHKPEEPLKAEEAKEGALVDTLGQFTLQDHRTTDEVVKDLLVNGFVPSWCTACYRKGRTGEAFMKIAKKGDIHNFCHPNSLLTLEEYLLDYASPETRDLGRDVIEKERKTIMSDRARANFDRKMTKIDQGARDLYF